MVILTSRRVTQAKLKKGQSQLFRHDLRNTMSKTTPDPAPEHALFMHWYQLKVCHAKSPCQSLLTHSPHRIKQAMLSNHTLPR
eukprot:54886-Pelagomonas_calceolata.AAC.3